MPRPRNPRTIRCDPAHPYFKPRGIPLKDIAGVVDITLEELETIRLSDLEGLSQTEVGEKMNISQSSVSRHLEEAHRKIAKALVLGLAIRIANPVDFFHCVQCGHTWQILKDITGVKQCENCESTDFHTHIHSDSGYHIQSLINNK
ncbi:MAG: DUF134 domain-containing protein [Candidatus Heimdallarchaeota archaeon]|nr:MAG: DUF134 domain-containing protein [Candidatus Heimdallarchaeota archaeon]